ncbi:MAG: hypothetical protein NUW09_02535 [Deltaproteobacteria bacterium]|nr:hypothetical protein [Deltaproteobacteria bacterium]
MGDNIFSTLDDKALFDRLQQAELANRLLVSPEWQLVKEAADRIIERALAKFALNIKADDLLGVMETQMLLRKYKYGLFSEVEQLAQEGELYYLELKNRDSLPKE